MGKRAPKATESWNSKSVLILKLAGDRADQLASRDSGGMERHFSGYKWGLCGLLASRSLLIRF